jgi:hypothetical protein
VREARLGVREESWKEEMERRMRVWSFRCKLRGFLHGYHFKLLLLSCPR